MGSDAARAGSTSGGRAEVGNRKFGISPYFISAGDPLPAAGGADKVEPDVPSGCFERGAQTPDREIGLHHLMVWKRGSGILPGLFVGVSGMFIAPGSRSPATIESHGRQGRRPLPDRLV